MFSQPVVVENYDEIVLNEPHKLSPEAKASLLAGPTGSTQLTADDAYYLEHSPDADLSVLAGAHVFVRSETERESRLSHPRSNVHCLFALPPTIPSSQACESALRAQRATLRSS